MHVPAAIAARAGERTEEAEAEEKEAEESFHFRSSKARASVGT